MRIVPTRAPGPHNLRRPIERLDGLPLRPQTARAVLDAAADAGDPSAMRGSPADFDPGWRLATARPGAPRDPLAVVAERPWWGSVGPEANDALTRLWRQSAATSVAVERLAREAGRPDPGRTADAGLLVHLGLWAAAAASPDWLADWFEVPSGPDRRAYERETLGVEAEVLSARLARRWGLGELFAEAPWLTAHPRVDAAMAVEDRQSLNRLREATELARQTPWSFVPVADHDAAREPRLRALVAETQSRCPGLFVPADLFPREERLSRENARLLLSQKGMAERLAAAEGFVEALAGSEALESPERWAERAGRAWCGVPGVTAARVDWAPSETEAAETVPTGRAPDRALPLTAEGRTLATLKLWTAPDATVAVGAIERGVAAWSAWASVLVERGREERRFGALLDALKASDHAEGARLDRLKLDALAEFAAGAGHELNNPLAVVVGRAQLLLAKESDPDKSKSLRAILGQAQRAHRILRDLMYVARPPQPRMRYCQPDEIWRNCLRDATEEAAEREVSVVADGLGSGRPAWSDPDGLRHLAEILLRNAMEATPPGGRIRVSTSGEEFSLTWTVQDDGRGLSPVEAEHLFDPFFCGRQAGRGLGLGLPRASRFVSLLGGDLRWKSLPGRGATFTVRVPLGGPPRPLGPDARVVGAA